MGVRKGISVTPNVCSFVVQACGQAELQVRTPQISVPDPFPTSISSVLVVQCGGSNSWLSSSWSSFSPPRPAPEDDRHVNFSNILQWYSSTPMAMTILAPPNNRRTTPSRVRPCAGVEAPPRPWQWRDYPSPQCCHCFAAEPSFTLLPKLAVILHSPQSRERCLL